MEEINLGVVTHKKPRWLDSFGAGEGAVRAEFTHPEEEVEQEEQILQVDEEPVFLLRLVLGHGCRACKRHTHAGPRKDPGTCLILPEPQLPDKVPFKGLCVTRRA